MILGLECIHSEAPQFVQVIIGIGIGVLAVHAWSSEGRAPPPPPDMYGMGGPGAP